jgi:MPBQ/MSBQ methyltransferase
MIAPKVTEDALARTAVPPYFAPHIGLEQYYREAGPDYAAWSREFNMHFGYYRACANPLHREAMLEQMNAEVLARLQLDGINAPRLLDLGCGLGATLRSFARRLPGAKLFGLTRASWQVEHACALNEAAGCGKRVCVIEGDYEDSILPPPALTVCTHWRAVATRTGRTRASCWTRRTACCDPVDA